MKSLVFILPILVLVLCIYCTTDASDITRTKSGDYIGKINGDYQNYRNIQYGFELKYPAYFEKQETYRESVFLRLMKMNQIEEGDYKSSIGIEVESMGVSLLGRPIDEHIYFDKSEKIEVDGRQGFQYYYWEGVYYDGVVVIPLADTALSISYGAVGRRGQDVENFVRMNINRIVSTFKYLE